ncbi:MAG: hypothetical protein CME36_09685 [unclassified Hahellaceae]|nr:hypothetical protein [Hahellaceae bacterium]|tara:strand:- start:38405 stop:40453 length:2049 start_codon:yes stop_codon:yes gene_type:complete
MPQDTITGGGDLLASKNRINKSGELLLYGEIGDWFDGNDALSIVTELESLNSEALTVRIHSGGGSIMEGLAIYNRLKQSSAFVTVQIDGIAASMASVVAMAGDKVTMPSNGFLMVHKPWLLSAGNADELRKSADTLDSFEDSLIHAYTTKTGMPEAEIREMLSAETWINAAQALEMGFIDEISDAMEAAASIDLKAFNNVPDALLKAAHQTPAALPAKHSKEPIMAKEVKAAEVENVADVAVASATTEAPKAEAKAAVNPQDVQAAERQRFSALNAVRAQASKLNVTVTDTDFDRFIASGSTADEFRAHLFNIAEQANNQYSPTGCRVESNMNAARNHIVEALMHRADPAQNKLSDQAREFRGMTLLEMARASLSANGMETRGKAKHEIAAMAMHSTSDFPLILGDTINKSLRRAYEYAPRVYQQFSRRSDVSDFKPVTRALLGEAPLLEKLPEGAEVKYGTIGEESGTYAAATYAKAVGVTRQMLINDDLGAFTRLAAAFGSAAGETENDIVFSLLIDNVKTGDNVALFHATHGNVGTAGPLSETTLSEARRKMRVQKGVDKERLIRVTPQFLIIPAALETTAQKILSSVLAADTASVNIFANSLTLIVDPRLDEKSETAWYLIADPGRIDTIEYGYLDGTNGVYTDSMIDFSTDCMKIKARLDFAAGVIDYRGMFRNLGA